MESNFLRTPALFCDLQKVVEKQNALYLLTTLNEITSSNPEEMEFLCRSDWILMIMSFLECDTRLANISLKILANASKKHAKVRSIILNNNIFHILSVKLRNETDFSQRNIILYSALIAILVQRNQEAQNQMRTSGCLSSLVYILNCILDEADINTPPSKNAELIIYTIIVSSKNPRNLQNQTEIGYIIPKILKFIEKKTDLNGDQLQLIECFWFFLKSVLDKNKANQEVFLQSSGLSVLFRNIQNVTRDCKTGDLLVKMTGILVNLKSHKEFLQKTSNYCPVMILCSLLETCNSLVIQRIIIFLDSLTLEYPQTLQLMKNPDILRRIKKVRMILIKSETAAESCKNIWNRLEISQEESSNKSYFKSTLNSQEVGETNLLKNHFCVVHGNGFISNFQAYSLPSSSHFESVKTVDNKFRNQNLTKIRLTGADLNFHKRELREKKKKLTKIVRNNFSHLLNTNFLNIKIFGGKILLILRRFLFFFVRYEKDESENRFQKIA